MGKYILYDVWFLVCDSPEIIVTSHKQVRYLENCTMLVGNLKVSVKLRGMLAVPS